MSDLRTDGPDGPTQPSGPGTRKAFIHIGAPKTGTTYLQGVLWQNADDLRAAGLDIVGVNRGEHYAAGNDLRDLPFDPANPGIDWTGAWDSLAAAARASHADSVVISDEHLASLSQEQVARAVHSLAPREVHVIYATRNLAGLLPSEWQEYVKHRSKYTYEDWSRRIFARSAKGPGKWFWSVHDSTDVVARWSSGVPRNRIHILTLPPSTAPRDELWRRFASVVDVPADAATTFDVAENPSLGYAETELLRRVNEALPEEFPRWHYIPLTRELLATRILSPRSSGGRPSLPEELVPKLTRRAQRNYAGLRRSGCDIQGDLESLRVTGPPAGGDPPPRDSEVLDAAVEAVAALLVQMARNREDRRRWEERAMKRLEDASGSRMRERAVAYVRRHPRLAEALIKVRKP